MTNWIPDLRSSGLPKYKAIASTIVQDMRKGVLTPGQKLPPQRLLADFSGVTIGTVTRWYAEAERSGIVEARIGSGTYVCGMEARQGDFQVPEGLQGEVVDLGLNCPLPGFGTDTTKNIMEDILADRALLTVLLSYQSEFGLSSHRCAAKKWLIRTASLESDISRIVFCNGGQHALLIALMSTSHAGEYVLADGLTYPRLQLAAQQLGIKLLGLEFDENGVCPDSFNRACRHYRPKAYYCCPTLGNLTASILHECRRREILQIARRHDVVLIEDDTQGSLLKNRLPSLASDAPDQVLYFNNVAKYFAGGLRCGVLVTPDRFRERIALAICASGWMTSPLLAEVASRWMVSDDWSRITALLHTETIERQKLFFELFEGFSYTTRTGSFYVWLNMPHSWRAMHFVEQAKRENILIKSAETFAVGHFPAPQAVRISLNGPADRDILRGALETLRNILKKQPVAGDGTM